MVEEEGEAGDQDRLTRDNDLLKREKVYKPIFHRQRQNAGLNNTAFQFGPFLLTPCSSSLRSQRRTIHSLYKMRSGRRRKRGDRGEGEGRERKGGKVTEGCSVMIRLVAD